MMTLTDQANRLLGKVEQGWVRTYGDLQASPTFRKALRQSLEFGKATLVGVGLNVGLLVGAGAMIPGDFDPEGFVDRTLQGPDGEVQVIKVESAAEADRLLEAVNASEASDRDEWRETLQKAKASEPNNHYADLTEWSDGDRECFVRVGNDLEGGAASQPRVADVSGMEASEQHAFVERHELVHCVERWASEIVPEKASMADAHVWDRLTEKQREAYRGDFKTAVGEAQADVGAVLLAAKERMDRGSVANASETRQMVADLVREEAEKVRSFRVLGVGHDDWGHYTVPTLTALKERADEAATFLTRMDDGADPVAQVAEYAADMVEDTPGASPSAYADIRYAGELSMAGIPLHGYLGSIQQRFLQDFNATLGVHASAVSEEAANLGLHGANPPSLSLQRSPKEAEATPSEEPGPAPSSA